MVQTIHQKHARGKLAEELATRNILLLYYYLHWTSLAFLMVLRAKYAT